MDLTLTLISCGALLAIAVFCGWRGAAPPDPNKGPRMIPYRAIMLLSAALMMILLIHVAALLGLLPGR